jgi:hypothetical protein
MELNQVMEVAGMMRRLGAPPDMLELRNAIVEYGNGRVARALATRRPTAEQVRADADQMVAELDAAREIQRHAMDLAECSTNALERIADALEAMTA